MRAGDLHTASVRLMKDKMMNINSNYSHIHVYSDCVMTIVQCVCKDSLTHMHLLTHLVRPRKVIMMNKRNNSDAITAQVKVSNFIV